jgi:hypothetical protein
LANGRLRAPLNEGLHDAVSPDVRPSMAGRVVRQSDVDDAAASGDAKVLGVVSHAVLV